MPRSLQAFSRLGNPACHVPHVSLIIDALQHIWLSLKGKQTHLPVVRI